MKTNGLFLAIAATVVLTGCSKEENGGIVAGAQELRLTSGIEAVTRGSVQSTAIVAGETVYTWVADAKTGAALYNANALTAQAGGVLSGGTPMYFPQTGNAVNIAALHGQLSRTPSTGAAMPASFAFTVAADQSEAGGANYLHSDLLYAARNVKRTKEAIELTFYHMLSKLELRITKSSEVTDAITAVTLDDVVLGGLFTPATGDLADQSVRAAMIGTDDANTGDMTLGAAGEGGNGTSNDAIVVPQQIGGKTLTFTLRSGGTLIYTIPEGKEFASGKKHVYEVTLKLTGLDVTSTIEDWDDGDGSNGDATMPEPPIGDKTAAQAAVGYYCFSDGSLADENAELSEKQLPECIGVVFWVGDPTKQDAVLKKECPKCTHGLIVALEDLKVVGWQSKNNDWQQVFGSYSLQDWLDKKYKGKFAAIRTDNNKVSDNLNKILGYNNTKAIELFNADPENARYPVEAVEAVVEYRTTKPAPKGTSDWFLPSTKEISLIFCGEYAENIDGLYPDDEVQAAEINARLEKAGGQKLLQIKGPTASYGYFSSQETTTKTTVYSYFPGIFPVWTLGKTNSSSYIRPVLAF